MDPCERRASRGVQHVGRMYICRRRGGTKGVRLTFGVLQGKGFPGRADQTGIPFGGIAAVIHSNVADSNESDSIVTDSIANDAAFILPEHRKFGATYHDGTRNRDSIQIENKSRFRNQDQANKLRCRFCQA